MQKKTTKARAAYVFALAAGVVLLHGCRENTPAAATAPRIELKAVVAPFDSVTVYAPIEGRVAQVRVAEGAAVQAGAVIATLSNPTVARDLVFARSAVETAEYRLGNFGRADSQPVVRRSKDAESFAADIVRQRQQVLDRTRRLLANGDVAKQDVENAELALTVAQRDLHAVQEQQSTLVA
ncbi:MAG TPA: biotin/lipoyl-binding protein, partial [Thermoanaerobaculia bacterium]|nr:biotin/lipoyl-binding protein [Thermoanaerobaculia bacterium]